MGIRKVKTIANIENKAIGAAQKFLDTDFDIEEGNRILFSVVISDSQMIEYTRNGTDYILVNNIADATMPHAPDGDYRFGIMCSAPGKFNIRTKEGDPTTLVSLLADLFLET